MPAPASTNDNLDHQYRLPVETNLQRARASERARERERERERESGNESATSERERAREKRERASERERERKRDRTSTIVVGATSCDASPLVRAGACWRLVPVSEALRWRRRRADDIGGIPVVLVRNGQCLHSSFIVNDGQPANERSVSPRTPYLGTVYCTMARYTL